MTDIQQQARAILDQLAFMAFDQCIAINRQFSQLPALPGIYAITTLYRRVVVSRQDE